MANTFKNNSSRNIGTTAVAVYTAAAGVTATIIGMTICNTSTASVKVSVAMNDGNDTYILGSATPANNGAVIAAGDSLIVFGGDHKLVLEPTNSIKVISSAASSLDAVISSLEIT